MAPELDTSLHIADPDGFYQRLIELHEGLTPEESQQVNARLILLLANQVGDPEVLNEILAQVQPAKV